VQPQLAGAHLVALLGNTTPLFHLPGTVVEAASSRLFDSVAQAQLADANLVEPPTRCPVSILGFHAQSDWH